MLIQNLQTSPIPQTSFLPWIFFSFSNLIYSTISLNQVFFILCFGCSYVSSLLLNLLNYLNSMPHMIYALKISSILTFWYCSLIKLDMFDNNWINFVLPSRSALHSWFALVIETSTFLLLHILLNLVNLHSTTGLKALLHKYWFLARNVR